MTTEDSDCILLERIETPGSLGVTAPLFEAFEISWVMISVRKSQPIQGVLSHAGIRITRRRA